jgi:hypothetical protein
MPTPLGLPYPLPADPVSAGAADIRALAEAVDSLVRGYGTVLPASPVNGQEFVLVDSITAPFYQWRLRYNAGSTYPQKWEFVGGAPASRAFLTSQAASPAATWVQAEPYIVVPRPGVYLASFSVVASFNVSTNVYVDLLTDASPSGLGVQAWATLTNVDAATVGRAEVPITIPAAPTTVKHGYYVNAAGVLFERRYTALKPVRLS